MKKVLRKSTANKRLESYFELRGPACICSCSCQCGRNVTAAMQTLSGTISQTSDNTVDDKINS